MTAVSTEASALSAEAAALRVDVAADVVFEVEAGALSVGLTANGDLVVEELSVLLGDVEVSAEILPPRGVTLTNISIALAEPATAIPKWLTDDEVSATIVADLVLSWATRTGDREIPLGDVRVSGLPLELTVRHADGALQVGVDATRDGAFWSWANTFELRDLSIRLEAR